MAAVHTAPTRFSWNARFFLALTAVIWFSMVADQLPCFLGVPVCD